MKNLINLICILFLAFAALPGMAQSSESRERIESAKIGFMTNRLNLTPEQSSKFWPVYNEYSNKKQDIRQNIRQLRNANKTQETPETQIKANIDQLLSLRQKEVDLEKQYVDRFLKVLSPRQLVEMYRSEHEFNRMLLERLEDRRADNH
jgi:Spy/CpxP family protein refolding chaperone